MCFLSVFTVDIQPDSLPIDFVFKHVIISSLVKNSPLFKHLFLSLDHLNDVPVQNESVQDPVNVIRHVSQIHDKVFTVVIRKCR